MKTYKHPTTKEGWKMTSKAFAAHSAARYPECTPHRHQPHARTAMARFMTPAEMSPRFLPVPGT